MTGRTGDDAVAEMGDAELVARIVSGDEAALMAVYDRHGDALFGIAVRFLADREAASEVVQEVFLSLWQRAARFDPAAGSLLAWLIGITRHRALDRLRAEARRPRLAAPARAGASATDDGPSDEGSLGRGATSIADDEPDPAEEIDRRWSRAVVRSALAEMPDPERRVLLLAYDDGLSQSEIALRLGWPLGTVKSRTRRALATLRERLVLVPGLLEP